jgi:hypothetical protein
MKYSKLILLIMAAGALTWPRGVRAQGLLKEALSTFPADTLHLEVSSPAALRKLPNYSGLRARYLGPRLEQLESSLETLDIHEDDIDDLALGWETSGKAADLFGIAMGRFDTKAIAKRAEDRGISPVTVGGYPTYCIGGGLESDCALLLSDSEGAFGTMAMLNAMMDARSGAKPNLDTNDSFVKVVKAANTDAPIWGVATGSAIPDWFKSWMPSQQDVKMDWTTLLSQVDALTYDVVAENTVKLAMKFDCHSDDSATSLRQVLEGLRLAQQIAWQNQNPDKANPFSATDISLNGSEVQLKLDTSYDSLTAMGAPGNPTQ